MLATNHTSRSSSGRDRGNGLEAEVIQPDRWISNFKAAAFKPEVHDLVLKQNAIRALKLA